MNNLTVRPAEMLEESARTFRERAAIYGDNYLVIGDVLKALFPKGVALHTVEDHQRFHLVMLQLVKVTRYVQNWEAGGHDDSLLDLSVYTSMLRGLEADIRDRKAAEMETLAAQVESEMDDLFQQPIVVDTPEEVLEVSFPLPKATEVRRQFRAEQEAARHAAEGDGPNDIIPTMI